MDWIVAALEYLEAHRGVAAVLELATLAAVIAVYREGRAGRKKLHERIDEIEAKFVAHDKVDERRYGRIEGALGRIEGCVNGKRHGGDEP